MGRSLFVWKTYACKNLIVEFLMFYVISFIIF